MDARDKHGQFLPGTSGNPGGRPPKRKSFRELAANLPDDEKEAIVKAMAKKAKAGSVAAFEKLADRAEGKPAVTVISDAPPADSPLLLWLAEVRRQLGIELPAVVEGEVVGEEAQG